MESTKHAVGINTCGVAVAPGDANGIITQRQDIYGVNVRGDLFDIYQPLTGRF